MSKINPNYSKLQAGYLFPEIARRANIYQKNNPNAKIIRLGIGDTTEPLVPSVVEAMKKTVLDLSKIETYSGYGDSEGNPKLRQAISKYYQNLDCSINFDEVFVSDGAKSDCANIQSIFGNAIIGLQDPSYPVYVDASVINGQTVNFNANSQFDKLVYLEGNEENNFVAKVPNQKVDLIYLCYPNNPTGAVANFRELEEFVNYALQNKAIIIFDTAYSWFIKDKNADKCCIEINSFSKFAGFTGVRLGWSIIPKNLVTENSEIGKIHQIWSRRQNTFFNGACNIAQSGGIAALSEIGRNECQKTVDFYLENAKIIKNELKKLDFVCFGGDNAPFIWLKTPIIKKKKLTSWEFFNLLLDKCQIIGTPGSGFGKAGEGYFRLSAFGRRENILEGLKRIKEVFDKK
jgi:LL-diaminopimelate aminotransferase